MNPEIRRYLDEHGATYTPEALRKGLLDAGYDPTEVDAALSGWNAAEANGGASDARRTFGTWALRLHLGALLAVFLLIVALKGTTAIGAALFGCAVLTVALVIGWAISSLIGRALLGSGVIVALIVPLISALALGGSCFALLSSAIGTPPSSGTVDLVISQGLTFDKSGTALCYVGNGNVQVVTQDLGTVEGNTVVVSISWYSEGDSGAPAPAGGTQVSISLEPRAGTDTTQAWSTGPDTELAVDASVDGRFGRATFRDLPPEVGNPANEAPDPISGTITWECS